MRKRRGKGTEKQRKTKGKKNRRKGGEKKEIIPKKKAKMEGGEREAVGNEGGGKNSWGRWEKRKGWKISRRRKEKLISI